MSRSSHMMRGVRRLVFPGALAAVAALAATATVLAAGGLSGDGADAGASCTYRLPAGASVDAATVATALWVRTVVLSEQPGCGYALGSERLRGEVSRARWLRGDIPVRPFPSRYPATAYRDASPDPKVRQAVFVISRSPDAIGTSPLLMIVGLSAPDAGVGAYRVRLVLDRDENWRVDHWWRVQISSRDL
jgi:hypothetical protein